MLVSIGEGQMVVKCNLIRLAFAVGSKYQEILIHSGKLEQKQN